jgi:hypothetical protein
MLQEAEAVLRGLSLRACSAEGTTCRTRNDMKRFQFERLKKRMRPGEEEGRVALKLHATALLTPLAPVLAGT